MEATIEKKNVVAMFFSTNNRKEILKTIFQATNKDFLLNDDNEH
jgi:hypothetical protein